MATLAHKLPRNHATASELERIEQQLFDTFGRRHVPLETVCETYLGLAIETAKGMAARHELPFPAFRVGSQKAPLLVDIGDLAEFVDKKRREAAREWRAIND